MVSWKNKVIAITGAGSGIGRATALRFAARGSYVAIADLNTHGGEETLKLIGNNKALFRQVDVTSASEIHDFVDATVKQFGGIHLLHNNAGLIRKHEKVDDIPLDEFRTNVDLLLTAPFIAARAVAPIMRQQKSGLIITTASMASIVPVPTSLAYASAKAGVLGLTRSLAALLKSDGIRVNAILPGQVDTPLILDPKTGHRRQTSPDGLLDPDDVATAVEYLADQQEVTGIFLAVKRTPEGARQLYQVEEPELTLRHEFESGGVDEQI